MRGTRRPLNIGCQSQILNILLRQHPQNKGAGDWTETCDAADVRSIYVL